MSARRLEKAIEELNTVTKEDLRQVRYEIRFFRQEMERLATRLILQLAGIIIGVASVATAIDKLL